MFIICATLKIDDCRCPVSFYYAPETNEKINSNSNPQVSVSSVSLPCSCGKYLQVCPCYQVMCACALYFWLHGNNMTRPRAEKMDGKLQINFLRAKLFCQVQISEYFWIAVVWSVDLRLSQCFCCFHVLFVSAYFLKMKALCKIFIDIYYE